MLKLCDLIKNSTINCVNVCCVVFVWFGRLGQESNTVSWSGGRCTLVRGTLYPGQGGRCTLVRGTLCPGQGDANILYPGQGALYPGQGDAVPWSGGRCTLVRGTLYPGQGDAVPWSGGRCTLVRGHTRHGSLARCIVS